MPKRGPGKRFRKGVTLAGQFAMFPDDEAAEKRFIESRWQDVVRCAICDSGNVARRPPDTIGRMARGCVGKRLTREDLIGAPDTRINGQAATGLAERGDEQTHADFRRT